MQTVFALNPESSPLDVDLGVLNDFLPSGMNAEVRDGRTCIKMETEAIEDSRAQHLVDEQLDLIFFLTSIRAKAEMCRRLVSADLACSYRIHGRLQDFDQPGRWSEVLSLQLRLWSVAVEIDDPPIKLILFFQIIELSHPDMRDEKVYPPYRDESQPPDPMTEAMLLRHVVAHAGAPRVPTEKYLKFLGLDPVMSNRSDPEWLRVIALKVVHVQEQARTVIQASL